MPRLGSRDSALTYSQCRFEFFLDRPLSNDMNVQPGFRRHRLNLLGCSSLISLKRGALAKRGDRLDQQLLAAGVVWDREERNVVYMSAWRLLKNCLRRGGHAAGSVSLVPLGQPW
jgi:hypothetical protein